MDPVVRGKLIQERAEGHKARTLMGEIAPYLDIVEARCMKAWREDAKTPEVREEAWHRVKALDMIRAELGRLIEGGDIAEKRLTAKNA